MRLLAILLALLPALAAPAQAEQQRFRGEFALTFLGLPVARADFDTSIDAGRYEVTGSIKSAGLGAILDDTKGTVAARGAFARGGTRPESFVTTYVANKRQSSIAIAFDAGTVTATKVTPTPKPRGADWLPLAASDLKAVVDPMAANLIKADSLDDVCRQRVRLYDSEMRADLVFSYVAKGSVAVTGYHGPTVTCRMRFQPVSGYRPSKKTLKYLRDKSRIMVTFAPLGQTGVYAPVRATIGTEMGTLAIRARRFEARS